ncbi:hypothetical protein [Brevibacillus sp. NRS-1366]|uniref:hypothetical protein n=1 Tax=Brevibacillus sp. NRS-1366 TaxID=3233899 RepID=UPI003D258851
MPLLVGLMMTGSLLAGPLMQLTSLISVFVIVLFAAWRSSRIVWDAPFDNQKTTARETDSCSYLA